MMKMFCTSWQNVAFNPLIEQPVLVPVAPLLSAQRERERALQNGQNAPI